MELRVLINEALTVFHFILLSLLASGHQVIFLAEETTDESLYRNKVFIKDSMSKRKKMSILFISLP